MKLKSRQPVLSLKPTQFAVGILEVEFKAHELAEMPSKKRKALVESKPIPVVISPFKELCIIDHHHFLFACFHAGVKEVKIEVVADYSDSKLSYSRFWKKMRKKKYAYLYDQFGEGPRNPLYLPDDIRGMADDPYRSLAWIIRKEGAFSNSDETFSEFQWADFFREHHLLESNGRRGMHKAVKKGIQLVKKKQPSHLPGALKKSEIKTKLDRKKKKKTKFIKKEKERGRWATALRKK
jgi:hypothetical protein